MINLLEDFLSARKQKVVLNGQCSCQSVFSRVNKTIVLLRKLKHTRPRKSLVTIYKSFTRPHLDYGDVVYDQCSINNFMSRKGCFLPKFEKKSRLRSLDQQKKHLFPKKNKQNLSI